MARFNSGLRFNSNIKSFFNSAPRRVSVTDTCVSVETININSIIPSSELATTIETLNVRATILSLEAKPRSLLTPWLMLYEDNGADAISVVANIPKLDAGDGKDTWGIGTVAIFVYEDAFVGETTSVRATIPTAKEDVFVSETTSVRATIPTGDTGASIDIPNVTANIPMPDDGRGAVELTQIAKLYFYVTEDGILNPLGVHILRDSDLAILPGVIDICETIPGRHGDISFDSQIEPRLFELHVAKDCPLKDKGNVKRELARLLQPATLETKPLAFAEDPQKMYKVKYVGKIEPTYYMDGFDFTIPLKANDPFVYGSFENIHFGSGILRNSGDYEAPLTIEISGPITNPVVVVGGETLRYTGTLVSTDILTINTAESTVEVNGVNALPDYQGKFPVLQPGETSVTAPVNTLFRWRDRWL